MQNIANEYSNLKNSRQRLFGIVAWKGDADYPSMRRLLGYYAPIKWLKYLDHGQNRHRANAEIHILYVRTDNLGEEVDESAA